MKQRKPQQQSFIGGAAILAVGVFLVKVISLAFKVPIINILGAGYQDFTNAYNIYSLLLSVATAGLPVALSKMIAEANTLGARNEMQRIFRVAMLFFMGFCFIGFLIMFFFADPLAYMMGNTKSALSIRVLAPAVLGVGVVSALRGYAQGKSNMIPTSVSQVIEAVVKLVGLPIAILLFARTGADHVAAAGAIGGVTIGTFVALIYLLVNYHNEKKTESVVPSEDVPSSYGNITKRLLALAIPITITSSAMFLITLIDNSLVQWRLQLALGMSEDATRTLMSNYTSVQVLYQLAPTFMMCVTASIIPAVTQHITSGNHDRAATLTGTALKMSGLIAFPAGFGLMALCYSLTKTFCGGSSSITLKTASDILWILGLAAIVLCMTSATNAILQAYGKVNLPMITMTLGGIVMIIFDYFFVAIPSVNVYAPPVGAIFCYLVPMVLNMIALKRLLKDSISYRKLLVRPLIASAIMGLATWGVYKLIAFIMARAGIMAVANELTRSGCAVAMFISFFFAVILYAVLIIVLRVVTRDDMAYVPKGDKLARILHIR